MQTPHAPLLLPSTYLKKELCEGFKDLVIVGHVHVDCYSRVHGPFQPILYPLLHTIAFLVISGDIKCWKSVNFFMTEAPVI